MIVKEALANGRLTAARRRGRRFAPTAAERRRLAPDALALAAALAQPWSDVVLSGAATPAMLASNLAAATVALDGGVWARLEAVREAPDAYWETRSGLDWN